jgi:hypothetical protein
MKTPILPFAPRFAVLLAGALSLPLLTACLDKSTVATVPDAENQLFTPDGRLIVTGGTGAFEIVRSGSGYAAQPIAADVSGSCDYVGLAQVGAWVFTACQQKANLFAAPDNHLLVAKVVAGQPLHFLQVPRPSPDPMDTLGLPNGMAVSPTGQLLLADSNLTGWQGGVARLTLDLGGSVPAVTRFEANWLGSAQHLMHPNGVRVAGKELFVSDLNYVKRYQFDAAGNVPATLPSPYGPVANEVTVYSTLSVLDDIQPLCGGLAIDDFLGGKLVYMAPAGPDAYGRPTYRQAWASAPLSLQQPSSVQVGRGPLFSGTDVLVTEKGVIGDETSGYGNKLSRIQSPLDLNDPASCTQLNGG